MGTLVDYKTIRLGGYHDNEMDAAIAEPADPNDLDAGVRSIGAITGVAAAPRARARVEKVGWATGYTAGPVRFPTIGAPLEFGSQEALFLKQVAILGDAGAFARRGDSGAAVLIEDAAELAAMVIGVDDVTGLTIATPIEPVLRELKVWPL